MMNGLHLTADLKGCPGDGELLVQVEALRSLCLREVRSAGLQPVGELFHRFPAAAAQACGGVTGVVLLAESHLAVHTWPERGAVTVDVFVCNLGSDNSASARRLLDRLIEAFAATDVTRHALQRGDVGLPTSPETSGA